MQLIYFNSGTTAVTALITGETPISQTAGPGVINAPLNGADTVMIAGGNVTLDYWMLSRLEIKTPEQLRVISWKSQPPWRQPASPPPRVVSINEAMPVRPEF